MGCIFDSQVFRLVRAAVLAFLVAVTPFLVVVTPFLVVVAALAVAAFLVAVPVAVASLPDGGLTSLVLRCPVGLVEIAKASRRGANDRRKISRRLRAITRVVVASNVQAP